MNVSSVLAPKTEKDIINDLAKRGKKYDCAELAFQEKINIKMLGAIVKKFGPNIKNDDGDALLPYFTEHNNIEIVKYLLKQNAKLNIRDGEDQTALMIAADKDFIEICKMLIAKGAALNASDEYNAMTPLHTAAYKGNYEICKLLIKAGANIKCLDGDGYNALELAVHHENWEIANLLIDSGARFQKNSPL
jgi:ankyrin repeat protein